MEITKMTSKGQITIPIEVRKALKLEEGSKVAFVTDDEGRFYIMNSSFIALKNIQASFAGEAEKFGLKDENDVVKMIKEFREEE
ncbi:MAG: AbrB/MazE/SpoVT family DNA-binding domain-containing protein [Acholeplasmatales bacterium]|jgi:AbrB family looped-hinge helix DNA binding protein|nr:AbrB/MazE/SpoVT family DNA-binding domain-containing protein [Acholeplasmatales bacterium]